MDLERTVIFDAPTMLRTLLDEITDCKDVATHAQKIELVRVIHPHSIKALSGPKDTPKYNCVMFALGIETDDTYLKMCYQCPDDVHANTAFVQFLIDRGDILEQSSAEPKSLVVYFGKEKVEHIGRVVDDGRVQSKWGTGLLYQHAIFEVPANYGDTVRFFTPMERRRVLRAFFEFAMARGVPFRNRHND